MQLDEIRAQYEPVDQARNPRRRSVACTISTCALVAATALTFGYAGVRCYQEPDRALAVVESFAADISSAYERLFD